MYKILKQKIEIITNILPYLIPYRMDWIHLAQDRDMLM
jgi:hypothetical protein